jgi:hypothetical protein
MGTDSFDVACIKLFFELLRRNAVSAGQLNISDTESAHLVQGPANILLELLAQTVKLKTYRPFEVWSNTGGWLLGNANEQEGYKYNRKFHVHLKSLTTRVTFNTI